MANYLYVLQSRQDYPCTEERGAWRYRLILMPDALGASPPINFATPPARKGRSKGGVVASGRETSGADGTGEGGHGGPPLRMDDGRIMAADYRTIGRCDPLFAILF